MSEVHVAMKVDCVWGKLGLHVPSGVNTGIHTGAYRGTSLKLNNAPLGPYTRPMSRALSWSWGGGGCL
jgi:hypothetical protein